MNFIKLLGLYGFDPQKAGRVMIVRHTPDEGKPELIKHITPPAEHFEAWQSLQRQKNPPKKEGEKPTPNKGAGFWKCDTFLSFCGPKFYGEEGGHARFVGVFANDSGDSPEMLTPENARKLLPAELAEIYGKRKDPVGLYKFQFRKLPEFRALEKRVIVKYPNPRSWVQVLTDDNAPEVLAILSEESARHIAKPFPGMGNVRMSFDEMAQMVNSPVVYGDWQGRLKSSKGVYLITEKDTGKMYVGAAYGDDNIFARWGQYAKTKHCNNAGLVKRLKEKPTAYRQFQFSILQQLPESANADEVLVCEKMWKNKLRTREFGYNHN